MIRSIVTTAVLLITTACANAKPPNFILIYTDDHGYADLSSQDVLKDIKTPHIDAMAKAGVRMSSGYSSAPQCVPSRAGLMSGKYQNRFGVESNGLPLDGFNAELTVAERLKAKGYATGMIGKWHLGKANEIVTHGFDDVFYQGGSWTNFDFDGNDVPPGTTNKEKYHIDAGSAAAKAFIRRHQSKPFFLYLAYRAPHVPLDATKKYLDRFPGEMPERRRQALAMLSAVDDGVGGVTSTLASLGLEEQTLIFFIGDNGAPLKIHKLDAPGGGPGWDGSLNDPLNGEKGMLSEGGMRVPYVAQWKGTIPAGQTYDHPVIALDATATICQLAECKDIDSLDGKNLIPYLTKQNLNAPHEDLFWRWISQSAIRSGKWKYLRCGKREYLFDLDQDKEEKNNLLKEHSDVAKSLLAKLEKWSGELSPPGLTTKATSVAAETYFDFYLDGKPAPKINKSNGGDTVGGRVQGWITRGGTSKVGAGTLVVKSVSKRKGPFIASAGVKLQGNLVIKIESKHTHDGRLGISWRNSNQSDFVPEQTTTKNCVASDKFQAHELTVKNKGKAIHIRVLLPAGETQIRSIRILDSNAKELQHWSF